MIRCRQNELVFGFLSPAAIVGGFLLLLICGCSGGGDHPTLHPVTGELFVKGQPAAGATVIFHPVVDADPKRWKMGYPTAIVQPDGKFRLRSFEKDGAPAESYKVIAIWLEGDAEVHSEVEGAPPPKSLIDPQYSNPESTPWSVDVEPQRNELARFEAN